MGVLSIAKFSSAPDPAAYYLEVIANERDDYYLASGEAPEWIARQLGHTTTEMLFRVYSRFVPNLTRQDGSAIDRLLTRSFADRLPKLAMAPAADHRPAPAAANDPDQPAPDASAQPPPGFFADWGRRAAFG